MAPPAPAVRRPAVAAPSRIPQPAAGQAADGVVFFADPLNPAQPAKKDGVPLGVPFQYRSDGRPGFMSQDEWRPAYQALTAAEATPGSRILGIYGEDGRITNLAVFKEFVRSRDAKWVATQPPPRLPAPTGSTGGDGTAGVDPADGSTAQTSSPPGSVCQPTSQNREKLEGLKNNSPRWFFMTQVCATSGWKQRVPTSTMSDMEAFANNLRRYARSHPGKISGFPTAEKTAEWQRATDPKNKSRDSFSLKLPDQHKEMAGKVLATFEGDSLGTHAAEWQEFGNIIYAADDGDGTLSMAEIDYMVGQLQASHPDWGDQKSVTGIALQIIADYSGIIETYRAGEEGSAAPGSAATVAPLPPPPPLPAVRPAPPPHAAAGPVAPAVALPPATVASSAPAGLVDDPATACDEAHETCMPPD